MARTRSKPAPKEVEPEKKEETAKPLPESTENPPKLFILPKDTSPEARIVTLNNPATANPSRYLFCPDKGFYEFTKIAAPKKSPRSCVITTERDGKTEKREPKSNETQEEKKNTDDITISDGYITKSADLFIATPIDLLFLLLPALAPKSSKHTQDQNYLSLDDHLDTLSTTSPQLRHLLRNPRLSPLISARMEAFCDFVDAGEEKMYRLSMSKLVQILLKKAERMSKNRLPASMEDKFVKPQLEVPIMSVKREGSNVTVTSETVSTTEEVVAETQESVTTTTDSQGTTTSITTTETVSTAATSISIATEDEEIPPLPISTPPEIPSLLRLRIALTYLLTSYVPPSLRFPITTHLRTLPAPSFSTLDAHLTQLSKLRAEASVLQSLSNNISRKRGYEDDDEKQAEREEKKRRKEEEDKKKKLETRAVKQLKKVDTTGMKKLSSFFTKVPKKG